MLPNRLLVGAAWDWADVASLRLPKTLDVGFDCPNNEDMVRVRIYLLCRKCLHCETPLGDVKFTFVLGLQAGALTGKTRVQISVTVL